MKRAKLYISPEPYNDLEYINIEIPVPHGRVKASLEYKDEKKIYKLEAPKTLEVIFEGDNIEFIRI